MPPAVPRPNRHGWLSRAGFCGGRVDWFSQNDERERLTVLLELRVSNSAGGRSPRRSCRRESLNQPTYSTIASSSWLRVRQTRSLISSVLKVSTNDLAIALS